MRVGRETDEGDRIPEKGEREKRDGCWGDREVFNGCQREQEKGLVRVEERECRIP